MSRVFFQVFRGMSRGGGRWSRGFFCSLLDFGRKTDVMIFEELVLLLHRENISGPAGMALNCAPPFQIPGRASVGQCPGSQLIPVTPLVFALL